MRLLAALVVAGVLLAGCAEERGAGPLPGPARVDVDTPQLKELKEEAGVEPCVPGSGKPVSGGLPELVLACFGGGDDVDLAALRGPMVINLWASWCGPCRAEMPVLQAFHEQYADQVPILGINWQDVQATAAMELVIATGVTYPLLADPDASLGVVGGMPIRGLPGIVLLDADGEIAYRALEEIETEQELVDLVEAELGVTL